MSAFDTASVVSSRSSNPGGTNTRGRHVVSINDDVNQLTTFGNPFAEDEKEDSSFALVSSLFSKVKNSFAVPTTTAASSSTTATPLSPTHTAPSIHIDQPRNSPARRASAATSVSFASTSGRQEKQQRTFGIRIANPAPPLVSLTPVISEQPSFPGDNHSDGGSIRRGGSPSPYSYGSHPESAPGPNEGNAFGHFIPGFPINDDAKSIRTVGSGMKNPSASKVIRRLRGEGLSREYWMDDETCKECYDCKSVFTTWRRKHHCRICGQIFCSRCASNIIKASRFGADGMLRVCNLCLQKLEEESDDEDDRRSVLSVSTNFPAHQLDLMNGHHGHSPFTGSKSHDLYPIGEMKRKGSFDAFDSGSRPSSPAAGSVLDSAWEETTNPVVHPPFRRGLNDDDRHAVQSNPLESFISGSPSATARTISTPFPVPFPASVTGPSSIEFPGSPSSSDGGNSPQPLRSRFNSYATEYDPSAPFSRNRVHSKLELTGPELGDPSWRTRRESSAYAAELNAVSMFHLRIMLRQMIAKEGVPYPKEWEETLTRLALKVASHLNLNPRTQGSSMDARWYVKIKKIPGGAPRDSEYVDGAVITKNVAHKQMSRHIRQPRIMLVTFPFDYNRVEGQFMSIDPILAQEREYLKNLTSRVAAHHPHILLVEGPVSRMALEFLLEKKIAVARSVKPSAIQFVSRMTQSDIISSMDRLALEPRMGDSARFRIQTFEHALIPGRRKTYMRFEGCSREMGCTIILRGGDLETLKKIKKVTSFIVFIVRNLKRETYLWKDSVLTMPPVSGDAAPAPLRPRVLSSSSVFTLSGMPSSNSMSSFSVVTPSTFVPPTPSRWKNTSIAGSNAEDSDGDGEESDEESARLRLSEKIQTSIQPYMTTFISASATLRFPPPYPIRRMKELDDALDRAKKERDEEEAFMLLKEEQDRAAVTPGVGSLLSLSSKIPGLPESLDLSTPPGELAASPAQLPEGLPPSGTTAAFINHLDDATPMPMMTPTSATTSEAPSYFDQTRSITSETSAISSILSSIGRDNPQPATITTMVLKDASCIAKESELSAIRSEHQEMQRLWEWYLRKNSDDFVVEKYQKISLLHARIPTVDLSPCPPCGPPQMEYMTYYGDDDRTLGQFIEDTCRRGLENRPCVAKSCKLRELDHSQVYIHNESRLLISTELWQADTTGEKEASPPPPDFITTWSVCRVCGKNTPFIPMTEEACRYSFAKFLELHFYPADVRLLKGAGCLHNIYLHHIRYFAVHKVTLRFQTDPIKVYEVIFPPMRTRIRPEVLLELKNRDYQHMLTRNDEYWGSVEARVKQWESYVGGTADIASQERGALPMGTAAAELRGRLKADRKEITDYIHDTYTQSDPTNTLAVGPVRTAIQNKVVHWDNEFDRLEKIYFSFRNYLATERELKKLTGANLKRMYEFINGGPSSVSEAEGKPSHPSTTTQATPALSSASENDEATDADRASEPSQSEAEPKPVAPTVPDALAIPSVESTKSDGESDSTIGATRSPEVTEVLPVSPPAESMDALVAAQTKDQIASLAEASRLPRRNRHHPSVADLVRQFQVGTPPTDPPLSTSPPASLVSESDQEIEVPRNRRGKSRPGRELSTVKRAPSRAGRLSSVPPQERRRAGHGNVGTASRIPVPIPAAMQNEVAVAADQLRRKSLSISASPTKPHRFSAATASDVPERRGTPVSRTVKAKPHSTRAAPRDRTPARSVIPTLNAKGGTRRVIPPPPGSNVSSIAKQFERLSRDSEKANRRYAMMRGRRARPVASSKAKVEIFNNIMDAARDDSDESSEASSEADDEDEGEAEDERKRRASPIESSVDSLPRRPTEPPSLMIPDASTMANDPNNPYVDLTSPVTQRAPVLDDSKRSPLPPVDIKVGSPSSRPASPAVSTTVGARAGSSYTSGHSESEYSTHNGAERGSVIGTIVGYSGLSWMRDAMPSFANLKYPASPSEHLFEEAPITVREDEPTSIIAFTLQSPGYSAALTKNKATGKMTEKSENFGHETDGSMSDSQSWGVISLDGESDAVNDIKEPPTISHPVFHFESAGVQISCTVFHAEQFDALRRSCHCEHSMIESLARCLKWDASGGKSGSAFLKTRDNRFIAKELSRSELDAMSKFAPKYFEYMSNSMSSKRPTLLAKIFGFYKIVYKNPVLGKTVRMTLLVMENLFHDHGFCQVYDLKGSSRNRLVHPVPSKPNQVLLDENLLQNIHKSPFYIREHSKRILHSALSNDSLFLEDLDVMDYSLLVAVDERTNEIVVGMIDYIRTYTWDKKLETWVKESTFLGGAGKGEPTIVTPKQYRTRFLNAMERYFFLVPDRWMKEKFSPEDDQKDNW